MDGTKGLATISGYVSGEVAARLSRLEDELGEESWGFRLDPVQAAFEFIGLDNQLREQLPRIREFYLRRCAEIREKRIAAESHSLAKIQGLLEK